MDRAKFNRFADRLDNYLRRDRPYLAPVREYALYMERNKLIIDLHTDFDHAVIELSGPRVRAAADRDNCGFDDLGRQTKHAAYSLFADRWCWDARDFSRATFKELKD